MCCSNFRKIWCKNLQQSDFLGTARCSCFEEEEEVLKFQLRSLPLSDGDFLYNQT